MQFVIVGINAPSPWWNLHVVYVKSYLSGFICIWHAGTPKPGLLPGVCEERGPMSPSSKKPSEGRAVEGTRKRWPVNHLFATNSLGASLIAQLVKNLLAMQDYHSLIPGLGRSPREGKGYPLQYSGLKNSNTPWSWKELDMTEQLSLLLEAPRTC